MKLRALHIITQLELGGAQRNTLYTLNHLDRSQYDPILICGPGGILDEETTGAAYPVHFIPWLVRSIRPWKDLAALVSLYQKLREIRPHIVHTHSSKAGILGRIAAYIAGVPVIIHTFHGFGFTPEQPGWLRMLFVWIERFCALLSTHLIFVSMDNEDEAWELGIGRGKPHSLIRSGIEIPHPASGHPLPAGRGAGGEGIRHELGIPEGAWVVVSVGNFKPQKNPMDLVRTAKAVCENDPTTHFVIVGDGILRPEVEAFAQSEHIASQMHFLGWRQDIPAILASSNCFLLTSLWEGLPRALVEAAAAELPAVAYAVNGVKDILREDETGFPVTPKDPLAAAERIAWLREHPDQARRMGQNARKAAEVEFDIDRMVRQQEVLYKNLYEAVPLREFYEPHWSGPSA